MLAKISSILPSTPRITNVDVSVERPMRRGMPTFGLPVSEASNPRSEFKHIPTEAAIQAGTYDKAGQMAIAQKTASLEELDSPSEMSIESSLDLRA